MNYDIVIHVRVSHGPQIKTEVIPAEGSEYPTDKEVINHLKLLLDKYETD